MRPLYTRGRAGQAMLMTVLALGGTLLGATTIAGLLLVFQIRQATDLSGSQKAIYAADSGIEWTLYRWFQDENAPAPIMSNSSTISIRCFDSSLSPVSCVDQNVAIIRSKGVYKNVSRALELGL